MATANGWPTLRLTGGARDLVATACCKATLEWAMACRLGLTPTVALATRGVWSRIQRPHPNLRKVAPGPRNQAALAAVPQVTCLASPASPPPRAGGQGPLLHEGKKAWCHPARYAIVYCTYLYSV